MALKRAWKSSAHARRVEHRDGMRPQMGVERVAQRSRLPVAVEIEMRHLPHRVNAGIGAAGAVDGGRLAAERVDAASTRRLTVGPLA